MKHKMFIKAMEIFIEHYF